MPYGLEKLWDKDSVITYATPLGAKLRENKESTEENAAFLVRWAAELFGEWATWLSQLLPGCKVSYKTGTLRIVEKI